MTIQKTISPVDHTVYVERELADAAALDRTLEAAVEAQKAWRAEPLEARATLLRELVERVEADADRIADELTWQMGRPRSQTPGEVRGFAERARKMVELGLDQLRDLGIPEKDGFTRYIRREPLGLTLVLAPWNYPWLTSVNVVVPALMAGNTVVLKHASQTPLVAERFVEHARAAGIPAPVFSFLHMDHDLVADAIRDPRVGFVAFTGSVGGGHAVQQAAAGRFVGTGLELGGKDPGYVAADADIARAVDGLIDGAFFNSGQSCCGIER
ncbi:MAG: aldehyde dehydrogenase family protein, partial [Myxococcales bacterium]|nr:aldehyde dehydrogenase family protein [Myxococcales bacterium]